MDKEKIYDFCQEVSQQISLPLKGETAAITVKKDKTVALCYDRIWDTIDPDDSEGKIVPSAVRCFGGTEPEIECMAFRKYGDAVIDWLHNNDLKKDMEKAVRNIKSRIPCERAIEALTFVKNFSVSAHESQDQSFGAEKFFLKYISKSFSAKVGTPLIPIYSSEISRRREYQEGNTPIIVASLSNLNIVNEDSLTWDQVLEFRKDRESRDKYRRMIHWLDKDMIGKSEAFIEDEIAIKLANYTHALKKHGIKTILGSVSEALDGKSLLSASGIAGASLLAGEPFCGILAGGGLLIGKATVKLCEILLEREDVKVGVDSEISWVYEVKKMGN